LRQRGTGAKSAIVGMVIAGLIVYSIFYFGPKIWEGIQEGASDVWPTEPEVDMFELAMNYEEDYIPVYLSNNYMGQKIRLTGLFNEITTFSLAMTYPVPPHIRLTYDWQNYIYFYGEALEGRNLHFINTVTGIVTTLDIEAYEEVENCLAIHVLEAEDVVSS
jgi:hypothetical protein